MTDYTKLVAAVRDTDFGDTCVYCEHSDMCKDADCIIFQAADAIEALQAEAQRQKDDAVHFQLLYEQWKESYEREKRRADMYEELFTAMRDSRNEIIKKIGEAIGVK